MNQPDYEKAKKNLEIMKESIRVIDKTHLCTEIVKALKIAISAIDKLAKLEEAPKELSVNKIATTLKDIDFPFMKCVSKERVNEAYWDIAQELHDIASPIINRYKIGLEENYQKGRRIEIEHYQPIINKLKQENAELKRKLEVVDWQLEAKKQDKELRKLKGER